MATNLSIDPDLIERALEVSGERTKKAAVTLALQEFVARRRQKRLPFFLSSPPRFALVRQDAADCGDTYSITPGARPGRVART